MLFRLTFRARNLLSLSLVGLCGLGACDDVPLAVQHYTATEFHLDVYLFAPPSGEDQKSLRLLGGPLLPGDCKDDIFMPRVTLRRVDTGVKAPFVVPTHDDVRTSLNKPVGMEINGVDARQRSLELLKDRPLPAEILALKDAGSAVVSSTWQDIVAGELKKADVFVFTRQEQDVVVDGGKVVSSTTLDDVTRLLGDALCTRYRLSRDSKPSLRSVVMYLPPAAKTDEADAGARDVQPAPQPNPTGTANAGLPPPVATASASAASVPAIPPSSSSTKKPRAAPVSPPQESAVRTSPLPPDGVRPLPPPPPGQPAEGPNQVVPGRP